MKVVMPQLGETVAEGTVATWHKSVGDEVAADEILLDVETDKVSMEIPAPGAGTITEILVRAGDTVDVGTVLAVIQGEGDASEEPAPAAGSAEDDEPPPAAHSDDETVIAPTVIRTPAPAARSDQAKLSPAVRRLVAEHDLDIMAIAGSGRNGRVTRRDILAYLDRPRAAAPVGASEPQRAADETVEARPEPAPTSAPDLRGGTIAFNRVRKLTAEHMVRSKATSPHVLQAVEVDFNGVDRVRRAIRESFKAEHGYSLTYLPFIAHAVCRALREFPHANSSVQGDSLVLHDHVNLAIAVDLGPDGLVAPVIKAAENLTVSDLARSIHDLAKRARDHALKPDDLSGGTYTLSNSGTFGTLVTAPIINQPQVAILSTDGVRKKPVVIESADGDSIAIRPIGVLAQSFDHRAIDGAYSAAFLDRVRRLLENNNWFREL
jgi:pyruvate dehydrogenase E2 component (dihydrolipoamide acetyltransferase)